MKKPIILFVLLVVLGVAFYAYKTYNKEHTNVAETEASVILSALDLFSAFDNDETAAMTTYADKVLQVSGLVLNKDLSNELEPQLVLVGNGDNGFIRCGFKPIELEKVTLLSDSSMVSIKGECKGLNASEELDLLADKDVVLSNCIIIE